MLSSTFTINLSTKTKFFIKVEGAYRSDGCNAVQQVMVKQWRLIKHTYTCVNSCWLMTISACAGSWSIDFANGPWNLPAAGLRETDFPLWSDPAGFGSYSGLVKRWSECWSCPGMAQGSAPWSCCAWFRMLSSWTAMDCPTCSWWFVWNKVVRYTQSWNSTRTCIQPSRPAKLTVLNSSSKPCRLSFDRYQKVTRWRKLYFDSRCQLWKF